MVIVQLIGGLGNQFYQYSFAKNLAFKLKTELKIELSRAQISQDSKPRHHANYRLGAFNIQENFATPEEVKQVKEKGTILRSLQDFQTLKPNLENFKGDIFIPANYWMFSMAFFAGAVDIIKKEFTLKRPFSATAEAFKQKILSAEYPVSMHFRHGDFGYNPTLHTKDKPWFNITPLDYYYTCLDILKHRYSNLTVFVFSNNLQWVKENLHLDVPTEFVEGCATDDEEWILMSLCKFNIQPASTFAHSAFSLNSNPGKKIFSLITSNAEGVQKFLKELTPAKKDALLDSGRDRINVPFDYDNQPKVTMCPIFSLLLVVNNDAETIAETLDSVLNQDYEYYEVIIIDNASTDGSGKICQESIAGRENVTFKRLWTKVKNAEAWNMALKMTNGGRYHVSFLKGNDRFISNALTMLYLANNQREADILHTFTWLGENETGAVKYSRQCDTHFQNENRRLIIGNNSQEAGNFLLNEQINRFLGTKVYNRAFLSDNGIKFNESLADEEAELFFQLECFLKSKYFIYVQNACYIAPKNSLERYPAAKFHDVSNDDAKIVSKFNRYFTAHIDVQLVPKTEGGDFPVLFVSDDRAKVWYKAGWTPKGTLANTIDSYTGNLEFIMKTTVDGRINAFFRGLWVPNPEDRSKLIPYWVDYTKLTVNGKVIFDKLTPTWHPKPYTHRMDVKAGDEIRVQVEWIPHRGDT